MKVYLSLIISALLIRFSLLLSGQGWSKSHSQTVTFLILPIIGYVITNVIGSNIALSLGMVGALSIIRFRHPVKSPLELTIYFALLTIGISMSVNVKISNALTVIVCAVIILVKITQIIFFKFNKTFYSNSFNEGNTNNIFEIYAKKKIEILENHEHLINAIYDKEQNINIYRLNFENKKSLGELKKKIENIKDIIRINVQNN